MIIRALDSNSDWTFGSGLQSFKKDLPALEQNVRTRLRSWKGDSFSHSAEGVDYNNFLDIGTKSLLDSDVKRVILQSEGVIRIKTYESDIERSTREFQAEAEITTIFGSDSIDLEL